MKRRDMTTPKRVAPRTGKPHVPVLLDEVIRFSGPKSGGKYIDGTLGAGGHADAVLNASAPDGQLLGLDGDPAALQIAGETLAAFGERAVLVRSNFTQIKNIAASRGFVPADGVLLDLGLSSMQLANPTRGFSFLSDTLDMRMDDRTSPTAAELVNELDEEELANLIYAVPEEGSRGKLLARLWRNVQSKLRNSWRR